MSRTISIVLLLSCLFTITYAQQETTPGTFKASVMVGANASQIRGDAMFGFNKLGIHAGIRAAVPFQESWEAGLELVYTQVGSSSELSPSGPSLLTRISLDYVQIPITISYIDQRVRFTAGLAYGRLIRARVISDGIDNPDRAADYRKDDISFVGGGTLYLNDHFGLNLRWQGAILNLVRNPNQSAQRHNILTLRALYTF